MKHCIQCQMLFADDRQACPQDGTALRVVEDLQPGMIVRGKYRIVSWIGAGGMAAVFRARHELLNEDRALKVVLPKYSRDKDFLKRFRNEAAVARKLRHENAVWVEDLDHLEDGRPFMAMEFLRGRDLRGTISKEGPFSVERTLALAGQVASALNAAHELGIIHRDIKPDNIFIIPGKLGEEVAKVLDFGIAKALETPADGAGYTATKTGMIVGTPAYMSPEQARGGVGNKLDRRSDIYSLGIVIYEMLTGRLPFESDTPMDMLFQQVHAKPQPPHEMRPDLSIPPAVSLLLMRALEKEPAKRFQAANEMVEALRKPSAWATAVYGAEASAAPTKIAAAAAATPATPAPPVASRPVAPVAQEQPKVALRAVDPLLVLETKPETSSTPRSTKSDTKGGWLHPWMALPALALLGVIAFFFFGPNHHEPTKQPDVNTGEQLVPAHSSTDTNPGMRTSGATQPATAQKSASTHDNSHDRPAPAASPTVETLSLVPAIRNDVNALTGSMRAATVKQLLAKARGQRGGHDYKGAISTYNQILKVDPNNTEAKAGLAEAQKEANFDF